MGLRIRTNIASMAVQKNLKNVSDRSTASVEKLSSGKRITKAADDAAGLAIANNLEAQTRGLRQATRNANDGISLVQTAEGGLNEVSNILVRLRELSIQSASDTLGEAERGFLDKEYQELTTEIDRISQSTAFNGKPLLNGEGDGVLDFQVGAFAADYNRISFNSGETNAGADSLGVAGTGVGDKDTALSSIANIDEAINTVAGHRATLGSLQNRLQSTVANLEVQSINQDNARSVIQDVDVAQESASYAASEVVKSAGIATLAQANNLPNQSLRLIS